MPRAVRPRGVSRAGGGKRCAALQRCPNLSTHAPYPLWYVKRRSQQFFYSSYPIGYEMVCRDF
ncbi:protein of unknown function [Paraburkholderia dioscoreae]|uniref:Uncharacterized protein n=1 Tax=Paraburkholderia dioscoreae TaxID=2604047 RepID=A0A5Q4ZD26_9BURK|nr:protein of unknown function [Paraburkholderia dioscoreae]